MSILRRPEFVVSFQSGYLISVRIGLTRIRARSWPAFLFQVYRDLDTTLFRFKKEEKIASRVALGFERTITVSLNVDIKVFFFFRTSIIAVYTYIRDQNEKRPRTSCGFDVRFRLPFDSAHDRRVIAHVTPFFFSNKQPLQ